MWNELNWLAVGVGVVSAYGLGMIWFSSLLFGRNWAKGSHDIQPPASPPVAAMVVQLAATIALALVIGLTETTGAIGIATLSILATTLFVSGMDLFSQKSAAATCIDAGYILCSGALMIVAQAIF